MHLGESHTGGKAISPLIAVLLSTCTYESPQNDLIILTEQTVILPGVPGQERTEVGSERRTEGITTSNTFKIGCRLYLSE